ncbi:MAG: bifunctional 5,10-methylenetetrahydrofolate dehydrogenase/5,10-methenyltetrahydrofolate cyclohydrolase [Eubacterium ramulus]
MANLIDGKKISQEIKDELKAEVAELTRQGKTASLAVIQVGADPASSVYVRNKKNACAYIGIGSESYELPEETSEEELLALIAELNHKAEVRGILVQLPLPAHINEEKVILAIDPAKDVDGFHPQSAGALMIGSQGFLPCTPAGVIQLLKRSDIEIEGKTVWFSEEAISWKTDGYADALRENATVTVAPFQNKDLKELCEQADILIVAIGKPKFITEEYIKEGAAVIDVGIHRLEGKKLCGDVDFEAVEPHVSAITPVPGGVGPMTIAMLMNNCVETMR